MIDHSVNGDKARQDREFWKIINVLNLLLLFIVAYFLIYMQTFGAIASDTAYHIAFMDKYFNGEVYIPHPLWHVSVYYLSKFLTISYEASASIFTAFLITLYAVIVYKVAQGLDEYGDNYAKWFLITMIAIFIGPFFIMSLNSRIYMGPGSPSVWHNVTLLTVKPLALLSVYFTIKFFNTNKLYYFTMAMVVTIVSIFAKPSFIIVFLPSLVVYMLAKKYFSRRQLKYAALIILISVAILAYQYTHEFGKGNDGGSIIFDFLGVWSIYTPSVPVSIAMALGLPFFITLFNYQSVKKNDYIKFTWLLVLFSLIIFSCFAEGGKRFVDGNFSWSWQLSLSLIYVFTIIEYFKQYYSMPFIVRYSLLAAMLYQLYIGWYFLIEMFDGVPYNSSYDNFPLF